MESALFEEVAQILLRYDPIGLAAIGAPSDEYGPEGMDIIGAEAHPRRNLRHRKQRKMNEDGLAVLLDRSLSDEQSRATIPVGGGSDVLDAR